MGYKKLVEDAETLCNQRYENIINAVHEYRIAESVKTEILIYKRLEEVKKLLDNENIEEAKAELDSILTNQNVLKDTLQRQFEFTK